MLFNSIHLYIPAAAYPIGYIPQIQHVKNKRIYVAHRQLSFAPLDNVIDGGCC
jgi:hypothetical protein